LLRTGLFKGGDLIAEFGGQLKVLALDGLAFLAFEFFGFVEGPLLFDGFFEFVEGGEGAISLGAEGIVVEFVELLDLAAGGTDGLEGGVEFLGLEVEHGPGGVVDAEDVGPPLFQAGAVLVVGGVAVDEAEEVHVSLGVADDALVVAELEEDGVALIDHGAFFEEFLGLVGGEVEIGFSAGLGLPMVEGEVAVVGALAVGPTVAVELEDAVVGLDDDADLDFFGAVVADDFADVGGFVVGPVLQDLIDVLTHGWVPPGLRVRPRVFYRGGGGCQGEAGDLVGRGRWRRAGFAGVVVDLVERDGGAWRRR
jgi:hypothetical protein